jgi:hypothetical protein
MRKKQFKTNCYAFIPPLFAFSPSSDCRPSWRFAIVQAFSNQLSAISYFEDARERASRSFVPYSFEEVLPPEIFPADR